MNEKTQMMAPIAGNDYQSAVDRLVQNVMEKASEQGVALDWSQASISTGERSGDLFALTLSVPVA